MKCNICQCEMIYIGIDSEGEKYICPECVWKLR